MMSPFLSRARRALVFTPSVLVRGQIADDFSSLATLKKLGVLESGVPVPKVREVSKKLASEDDWVALSESDVVVGTPNSMSPATSGVAQPPPDLFDILLVDEAHHSQAKTWSALLGAFDSAHRVMFTATPYRRDRKQVGGRMLYVYSVKRAHRDGIYGDLEYVPVEPAGSESSDVAVARAAETALREDRAAGLTHCLMVRTDSRKRAADLAEIYESTTSLDLRTIHSGLSVKTVRKAVQQLQAGELDGIICVNMLGEGVDFPNLKLAAVHSPHKSLEVTIQFIGRFARTNKANIGTARFFAVPEEISGEIDKLWSEGEGWFELVQNLGASRIQREQRVRESYEKFEPVDVSTDETEGLPLTAFRPYYHVKIYQTSETIDPLREIGMPRGIQTVYRAPSPEQSAVVYLTKETEQPRWTKVEMFARVEYDLLVLWYDVANRLLFINSSRKSVGFYEAIARELTGGAHRILPVSRVNRVLSELAKPEFFNIGMKNNIPHSQSESYRIVSGPRAQGGIGPGDGRYFTRGHAFGAFEEGGERTTLGFSSASKVWSNRSDVIPELLRWCGTLSRKISSASGDIVTGSELDRLPVGEEISELPAARVLSVDWPNYAYQHGLVANYRMPGGDDLECLLVDLAVEVDRGDLQPNSFGFRIEGDHLSARGRFRVGEDPMFQLDETALGMTLSSGQAELSLTDFLRSYPLDIYLADFSRVQGAELFLSQFENAGFDREQVVSVDWSSADVDITNEFDDERSLSIHAFMRDHLSEDDYDVVIYDHRTGEVADFVCVRREAGAFEVSMFHIKKSESETPGARVHDVDEVCSQVTRSVRWMYKPEVLVEKLERRVAGGSVYLVGNESRLRELLGAARSHQLRYRVVLVQPGLSKSSLNESLDHTIAAAADYSLRAGAATFEFWSSE